MESGVKPVLLTVLYLAIVVFFVWLCANCAGCGERVGPEPDYVTSHGLEVTDRTNAVDMADIEMITDIALGEWGAEVDLRGWTITMSAKPCGWCDHAGCHVVAGYCAEGHICVDATHSDCLARTALGHELVHAMHFEAYGDFGDHEIMQPMCRAIRTKAILAVCPPGVGE